MKSNKIIIYVILFVLVIVGANLLYGELSKQYEAEQKIEEKEEKVKQKAIDFEVYSDSDESVRLSDNMGKPVVINFWATWCGPCREELPAFENMYKKYKDKVEFMMVNLTDGAREKKDEVKEFVSNNQYTFPVFYDIRQNAAYAYNITSVPVTVFVDADGNIDNYRIGALRENKLKEYIEELIN